MAAFEKETVFSLEDTIEYTDGGVISKQVTKSKAGNLTLFSFDKEQGLSSIKLLMMRLFKSLMVKQK